VAERTTQPLEHGAIREELALLLCGAIEDFRAEVVEHVPVVIFCVDGIAEGDEIAIGQNIHLTLPDNFNQLRSLLSRVLTRVNEPVATP